MPNYWLLHHSAAFQNSNKKHRLTLFKYDQSRNSVQCHFASSSDKVLMTILNVLLRKKTPLLDVKCQDPVLTW